MLAMQKLELESTASRIHVSFPLDQLSFFLFFFLFSSIMPNRLLHNTVHIHSHPVYPSSGACGANAGKPIAQCSMPTFHCGRDSQFSIVDVASDVVIGLVGTIKPQRLFCRIRLPLHNQPDWSNLLGETRRCLRACMQCVTAVFASERRVAVQGFLGPTEK